MKNSVLYKSALALAALLLTGCVPLTSGSDTPDLSPSHAAEPTEPVDLTGVYKTCRVADTLGDTLLLAEVGGSAADLYTLSTQAASLSVTDGQVIDVYFNTILETYPASFGGVTGVQLTEEPADDRCGLYLSVLEDLWETDPGLNSGISQLGLDLSGLTDLSSSEKSAVEYAFACAHDLFPALTGTWQELADQGYIDEESLSWEDGILFTLSGSAEGFDAQKLRSGDGAYFFFDCTANMTDDGSWTYEVGANMIS